MGQNFKFHTDVDTDQIIASQYLLYPTVEEMKSHTFESLDPSFASRVKPGDYVVAAENFGCGSSREQAPEVIKALGVRCVIAGSFARIFFRNAINNGLLLIECPALRKDVADGDEISVEVGKEIRCKGKTYPIASLSDNLLEIINAGGLVKAMRRRNGLE